MELPPSSRPKKIMVDASSVGFQMNGVKRYTLLIVPQLCRNFDEVHIYTARSGVLGSAFDHLEKVTLHVAPFSSKILIQWVCLPLALVRTKFDSFLSINHRFPAFMPHRPRLTMVVHDMCWRLFPETMKTSTLWSERLNFSRSVRVADQYIFLSKATRDHFTTLYSQNKKPHHVLFPHYDIGRPAVDVSGSKQPYFLFVGTIEPRKNLGVLIEAFDLVSKEVSREVKLVIAGSRGWKCAAVLKKLRSVGLPIELLTNVDQSSLVNLYANATAVVCPSKYEGFGLPVLESIHMHKPLICSDIPPFREIADNAALYFDQDDVKGLAIAMSTMLNCGKRSEYTKRVFARSKLLAKRGADYQLAFQMTEDPVTLASATY